MTDQPQPDRMNFGDILVGAMTTAAIAKTQAVYYKALVKQGIEPECAQQMTERALDGVLSNSSGIISALGNAAGALAPVIEQVTALLETPFVKTWTNELKNG